MTPRQRELLRFIERHIAEHDGVAPTSEQMRVAIGATSKSNVAVLLDHLEAQGRIVRNGFREQRSLSLPAINWASVSDQALRAEHARRFGSAAA